MFSLLLRELSRCEHVLTKITGSKVAVFAGFAVCVGLIYLGSVTFMEAPVQWSSPTTINTNTNTRTNTSYNQIEPTLLTIIRTLERDLESRSLRWIRVENTVNAPMPLQFQSVGTYDHILGQVKFYFAGVPIQNQQLYCRLYAFDAARGEVVVQVRNVRSFVTDSDSSLTGGVAICDKADNQIRTIESLTLSLNSTARRAIGLLTYDKLLPNTSLIHSQLVYSRSASNADADAAAAAAAAAGVSLLLFDPPHDTYATPTPTPTPTPTTTQSTSNNVRKLSIVTCVKGINSHVDPVRLIEWIEYTRLFESSRLVFYTYLEGEDALNDEAYRVLRFYEKTGFLQLWVTKSLTVEAGFKAGWKIKLWYHAVSMNLCLDTNRHRFDYVDVHDIDEIWVPKLEKTYPSLLARLVAMHGVKPFTFTTWPFLLELPHESNDSSVPISRRYFNRVDISDIGWKTVSPTSQCMVAHCHDCAKKYRSAPNSVRIADSIGALHHYRSCVDHLRKEEDCEAAVKGLMVTIRDESLLPYGDWISKAVEATKIAMSSSATL